MYFAPPEEVETIPWQDITTLQPKIHPAHVLRDEAKHTAIQFGHLYF